MEMLQQVSLYRYVTRYWCAERLCHYAASWNFQWVLVTKVKTFHGVTEW